MSSKQKVSRGVTSNLSTERALSIIELLAKNAEPMRLLNIAEELGTTPSTILRFVSTLQDRGYIKQDEETKRYFLTYKICSIANSVSSKTDVADIARPYLKKVSKLFGESSSLSVEEDMSVIYVGVNEGPGQMIKSMQRIGKTAPLHSTGSGKLFLQKYSDHKLDKFIERKGLAKLTENTIVDKESLVKELREIGLRGYAYDNEECEIGARCIAVPIYDYTGSIVAVINVTGPTSRMTWDYIASKKEELFELINEISEQLGFEHK